MVIGSLVEENDAPKVIEEKEKKKRKKICPRRSGLGYHIEVDRWLLRNNDLTFSLIKNEYIYTNVKHKNRKQFTQNTKIGKQF